MAPKNNKRHASTPSATAPKKGKSSSGTSGKENSTTNSQSNSSPTVAAKQTDSSTSPSTNNVATREKILLPFKNFASIEDAAKRHKMVSSLFTDVFVKKTVTPKDIEELCEPPDIVQMLMDSLMLFGRWNREFQKKREAFENLEVTLKAVQAKLAKEKDFVNLARWKEEAKVHINHKLMDNLFRKFIFLHTESAKTSDILRDSIVSGAHSFAKQVFDHLFAIFKSVNGNAELSKRMSSAEPNIYSKGQPHLLDNEKSRDEIWADGDFSSYVIRQFNTKRNAMARAIRVLCRK